MEEFIARLQFTRGAWIFIIPISLMAIDYATGLLNAWVKRKIKSSKMREGLAKKFGELSILAIGALFSYGFSIPLYVLHFISVYIIIMELISICENLNLLGVPIPKFIKNALNEANDQIQNNDKKK